MSSLQQNQPLSALAASLMENDSVPAQLEHRSEPSYAHSYAHGHSDAHSDSHSHAHSHAHGHGWLSFVFYFLVLALVFYFLYFALRPSFVLKNNKCDDSRSYSDDQSDEIDNGRLLGSAIITALILIFVFWVLAWLVGSF